MSDNDKSVDGTVGADGAQSLASELAVGGYWPATVMELVKQSRWLEAVQMSREHLNDGEMSPAGRLAYAIALYRAGQIDTAAEQFRELLAHDPNNLSALKYLGDIAFAGHDDWSALANYGRVLEIDPLCTGLSSTVDRPKRREVTRTITLVRPGEETKQRELRTSVVRTQEPERRAVVLVSETIGDLYLLQGHPRQAADVFQRLYDAHPTAELAQKLARAMDKISERESLHVAQTNE